MRILIAVETLVAGGAEIFCLRLAKALSANDEVFLYRFYDDLINEEITSKLAPGIPLYSYQNQFDKLIRKIDSLFFKLKVDFSLRNILIKKHLQNFIKKHQIDVIHSHQFKVDYITTQLAKDFKIPVVTTIHGDYLKFWYQANTPILNYTDKLKKVIALTDSVCCISDLQLEFFKSNIQPIVSKKIDLHKIYNGYVFNRNELADSQELKNKIGVPKNAFIYGMVSRGIPDKGWLFAIEAFIKLNLKDAYLILVGTSDYLDTLKSQYSNYKNIVFTGFTPNPTDYINIFDVALLPSVYGSESLPTVVIEYLFCSKPVIASEVGEIKNMIKADEQNSAGITIPVKENKVSIDRLVTAMHDYYTKNDLRVSHSEFALAAAAKFDMQHCIDSYKNLYQQ